jgi:hypothetical protein
MNIGVFGITVANPSASTFFRNNFIRTLHTHAMSQIGVQLGKNLNNASRITGNTVEMRTNTDGVAGEAALQVWGHANTIDLRSFGGGLNFGAKFEPGSDGNTLLFGTIQAATPIADFGTDNQFISNAAGALNLSLRGALFALDPNDARVGRTRVVEVTMSAPELRAGQSSALDLVLELEQPKDGRIAFHIDGDRETRPDEDSFDRAFADFGSIWEPR